MARPSFISMFSEERYPCQQSGRSGLRWRCARAELRSLKIPRGSLMLPDFSRSYSVTVGMGTATTAVGPPVILYCWYTSTLLGRARLGWGWSNLLFVSPYVKFMLKLDAVQVTVHHEQVVMERCSFFNIIFCRPVTNILLHGIWKLILVLTCIC